MQSLRHMYHLIDQDQISCRHTVTSSRPEGYPVLEIEGPEIGAPIITIFPTLGRLRRLHEVVGAYLASVGDAPEADTAELEEGRPVPVEAVCGHPLGRYTLDFGDLAAAALEAPEYAYHNAPEEVP